jgi:hypothetical protein
MIIKLCTRLLGAATVSAALATYGAAATFLDTYDTAPVLSPTQTPGVTTLTVTPRPGSPMRSSWGTTGSS